MRKILATVLALSMILVVCLMAGCGGTDTPATTPSGTKAPETTGSTQPAETTGGSTPVDTTGSTTPEETTGGTTPSEETTVPTTPGDELASWTGETKLPGYEDIDFRGTNFVIAGSTVDAEFSKKPCADIYSEGTDTVSVAIRKRNDIISKLYNCTIESKESDAPGALATADITGNQHTIDLYSTQYAAANNSTGTGNYNLLAFDIDFTKPWWDQTYVSSMSAKNSDGVMVLGHLMGDFCVYSMSCTYMLAFDKDVYETAGIEDKIGNIYQMVRDDNWTMDKFAEMIKAAATETSGNSDLKTDEGDILGWCTTNYAPHALHVASGLSIIDTVDGAFEFAMEGKVSEWTAAIDKAIEIWSMPEAENSGYGKLKDIASGHKSLFISEVIDALERWKDVEGLSLGLVPYPKMSETQDRYCNYVDNHLFTYAVPVSVSAVEDIADFITILAAHSNKIVRSAWIEAYSYEYCGDADSAEMLDIVLKSRTFDPAFHIWNFEPEVSGMITSGKNNITKWISRNADKVKGDIKDHVTKRIK